MRVEREIDEQPEVQMGPLIDCVFLLLIFFLVVAITKKTIRDLDIQLPDAISAEEAKPKDDNLVIRVTQDGRVFLGYDEMTRMMLKNAIRDAGQRRPDNKVLIEADVRTKMALLAPILDELQFSGLRNIAIRVSPPGGSG